MKTTVGLLVLFCSMSAFAGGSISREDALADVCSESAALCQALGSLKISESGEAVRLGRDSGIGGARITPYTVLANQGQSTVKIDRDKDGKIFIVIR